MPENVKFCPLCGGPDSRLFDRRQIRQDNIQNRICLTCGLVFQSPRMTDAEANRFYEAEYRQLYQGQEGPDQKDLAVQRARAKWLLSFAGVQVKGITRHLDIGCSAGLTLEYFQQSFNCQPVGIEPGNAYRAYAQRRGLVIYSSLEDLRGSAELPFDLISLSHVLEHLPDPRGYLAAIRADLLAPGGWLLVEVPNLYGHDCFEIAHLAAYSPHTLKQTIQQAGYEIVQQEIHGKPRSKTIPLYITMLARPAKNAALPAIIPEKGVLARRRFSMARRTLVTRLFPQKAWIPPDKLVE